MTYSQSYTIKQLKSLSNSAEHNDFLTRYKNVVVSKITYLEASIETEKSTYLSTFVKIHGDFENTTQERLADYLTALKIIRAALDQPISCISEDARKILNNPFPIMFAITLPLYRFEESNGEVNFNGPLMLGKDIPYVFVPADRINYVQQWVLANVPGKKKPEVRGIEKFSATL